VSAGYRFGKVKGADRFDAQVVGDIGCITSCPAGVDPDPSNPNFRAAYNWIKASATDHEQHTIVDFDLGRDVGFGGFKSTIKGGLRYGQFRSTTMLDMTGVPDWDLPATNLLFSKYSSHTYIDDEQTAEREFSGFGPTLSWDGSKVLFETDGAGRVNADWSLTGGVLFGRQKVSVEGREMVSFYDGKYAPQVKTPQVGPITTPIAMSRSDSATVPLLGAALGLSYEVQRVKISGGYRWERYFDVLDVGYDEPRDADRTIDGPYFKLSVGFGG
ncbi:MAG TPA: Lpg1974 family pore-forming outer membrane protein, partial [Caulobacteraceae bacterium]|nr:Lpg1974 family pore-forming outer membrane protein [Caulobacteraceae bacterium]